MRLEVQLVESNQTLPIRFSTSNRIKVKFSESNQTLPIRFSTLSQPFGAGFDEVHMITKYVNGEPYAGSYVVTPKVVEQTMPTQNKLLRDDMTIKSIPFFNVSNTSGGSTVYIGNEV